MLLDHPGTSDAHNIRPQANKLAHPPQSTGRLQHDQGAALGNCSRIQHRWRCITNRFASEPHCPSEHEPGTLLGYMVLHRVTCVHHLDPPDMGSPRPHVPARQGHNHRAHPPYEGQVHRRAVVHQHRHRRHHRLMVRQPPTRRRLRRHGRRSHHPPRPLLRHRHPHQRRLQQLPLDHHHPRRGRPRAG